MADGQHGSSGHTWIFPELLEGEGGSEGNFSCLGLKTGVVATTNRASLCIVTSGLRVKGFEVWN